MRWSLDTLRRYLSLKTDRLLTLPILLLEPHQACNCRCIMCDIWQGNAKAVTLSQARFDAVAEALRDLHTRWVVFTGGEAMLHPAFFRFAAQLKAAGIKVSVLSTGLLLKQHADRVCDTLDEVIVSLDGTPEVHDAIRRVPRAFARLADGVAALKQRRPDFPLSARCVVQRANFRVWSEIVDTARGMGLDRISFLPADVGTGAFNRATPWDATRSGQVALAGDELDALAEALAHLIQRHCRPGDGFVAESPEKLGHILTYYRALHGRATFAATPCNAPWVSAFMGADGTVRPCFFLDPYGNLDDADLPGLLNAQTARSRRRDLDTHTHPTCTRCVCKLHLSPTTAL